MAVQGQLVALEMCGCSHCVLRMKNTVKQANSHVEVLVVATLAVAGVANSSNWSAITSISCVLLCYDVCTSLLLAQGHSIASLLQ
jgi:hypothetical protein